MGASLPQHTAGCTKTMACTQFKSTTDQSMKVSSTMVRLVRLDPQTKSFSMVAYIALLFVHLSFHVSDVPCTSVGLRWVLVTDRSAALKSSNFHGYWSSKLEDYTVDFYSAAVRVDSPEDSASPDGLSWYFTKPTQFNRIVQGVDLSSEAPFKFLCVDCNEERNPCLYGGTCRNGTIEGSSECDCSNSGSSGRLCQILPTGNGRCDKYFNKRKYAWDGGDCCEETCVSTDENTCGRGKLLNSQGVGFIGYENCVDPSVVTSGSRTINDIKQRGVLQCGVILSTAWFYNFMVDQVSHMRITAIYSTCRVSMLCFF